MQYFLIGLGGFLGANVRYLTQQWAAQQWGAGFPYGTMIANVVGSFIIGLFMTLATGRLPISTEMRLFVAVGFLGGFTTFSSFTLETFRLMEQANWTAAAANFFGNTVLGFIGVAVGVFLAQWLTRGGGQ